MWVGRILRTAVAILVALLVGTFVSAMLVRMAPGFNSDERLLDSRLSNASIAAIRADASGMAVNNVPVIELQVHPQHGKKAGFFAGRDEQELRWMASELRRTLKVAER